MSITAVPKQGEGTTVRPDGEGVDKRLWVMGGVGVVVGLLAVVAVTTLDYVEVEVKGENIGGLNLWRADLDKAAIVSIGTALESDLHSPKAVIARFLGENKRHKQINEDLIANNLLCDHKAASATCSNLRDMTRLFVQSQGKLLPSAAMILAVLLVLPIYTMRCTNQALVLSVISFVALVNIVATTANLVHNLESRVQNIFETGFSTDISVTTKWRPGAIILFITSGLSGIFFLFNFFLCLTTRNDPYAPCDGPNFTEDNPMPPHFLPIARREIKPPQEPPAFTEPPPSDEHNAPYGNNGQAHEE